LQKQEIIRAINFIFARMKPGQYNLLLADDDADDCILFKEALEELSFSSHLSTVNNGVDLMKLLTDQKESLPDLLFLDLNMPRKNGFECLAEIKGNSNLNALPVIIFSTSFDPTVVKLLHQKGADYYMRKPAEFAKLKRVIERAITVSTNFLKKPLSAETFVLNME
jgi:CheY-like chemotaxis protein